MPDKPKSGVSLFVQELTEQTAGNLTTELFWGFLVIGLFWLAIKVWRFSGVSTRWNRFLKASAILLMGVWLCGPLPLTVYIVSRNITVLRDLVDPVVAQAPVFARRSLEILSTPVLAAPRIWHVLLVLSMAAVVLVLSLRRRPTRPAESPARRKWFSRRIGIESTETPPSLWAAQQRDEKPESDPAPQEAKTTDYLARGPEATASDRQPANQESKQSEIPAPHPEPPRPTCKAFNLTWDKAGEVWNPICPHCGSQMGVYDKHPTGVYSQTGRGVEVAVVRCSKPGCTYQVGLQQSKTNIRRRVQQFFDQSQNSQAGSR